ncbi:hypothetical protein PENSPDRAFT_679753 [Peniophora sp. CONT]|nr:hypothetical protein PENSPDRAFT_679753 [Peniophora sp. CONT]
MDSFDSYNYQPSTSGSRLLSETLPSGSAQDDLSLSELSLADRPSESRPFSLLPRHEDPATPKRNAVEDVEAAEAAPEEEHVEQDVAQTREERLSNDLYTLRKLNAAFGMYNEALAATESGTEVLAAQLEQTNTLLNMYVKLLRKTEGNARLIFDEQWQGASADDAAMEEEVRQREEQRRREEEERAEAERREREIKEREERERQAKEEQARLAREKAEKSTARSTSGVRGVRGTRASMRASTSRGTSTRGGEIFSRNNAQSPLNIDNVSEYCRTRTSWCRDRSCTSKNLSTAISGFLSWKRDCTGIKLSSSAGTLTQRTY